jgi:acyl-CoA reductase-like NAD-dependent aldehyde dehydrogenase
MDKDHEVSQAAPEQKLFVGGHWLEGQEWFEVRDKLSGDVLASVPICEDELLEMSVQAAHDAQAGLAQARSERAGALAAWAKQLDSRRAAILPLLHRESAIPALWADEEIHQAVAVLLAASGETAGSSAHPSGQDAQEHSLLEPVGTVAAILPERHSLFHAAQMAGAAIAAGCPVILVAHPLAPLSVIRFVEASQGSGLLPGALSLVYGLRKDLGEKLAADPRVSLLVSAGTNRQRDAIVSARGPRPRLEVGDGFAGAFLDRGADVSGAVTALLARRFKSPRFGKAELSAVLCEQALNARLLEALSTGLKALPGGRPNSASNMVSWQITENAAQAAEKWLTTISDLGGRVVSGGARHGLYVEPAVVVAPAGTRPIPMPPAGTPFFVVDSYDKHPRVHLARFPDLTEILIFTPDARRMFELASVADVERVDVIAPRPAQDKGQSPGGADVTPAADLATLLSGMTRRKKVNLLYSS